LVLKSTFSAGKIVTLLVSKRDDEYKGPTSPLLVEVPEIFYHGVGSDDSLAGVLPLRCHLVFFDFVSPHGRRQLIEQSLDRADWSRRSETGRIRGDEHREFLRGKRSSEMTTEKPRAVRRRRKNALDEKEEDDYTLPHTL
jgi:hypothetical protein